MDHPAPLRRWLMACIVLAALLGLTACGAGESVVKTPPVQPIPGSARDPFAPLTPNGPRIIPFTIQAGAFKSSELAARFSDRLQATGLDAYYFIDKDGMYKVRFERFATAMDARKRALELQSKGLIQDFYIAQPTQLYSPGSPGAMQASIVQTARRFLGSPYRYGKASFEDGFDCSGLTMTVYRLHGLDLPRSSIDQFYSGLPVGRNELQDGDLVFFATNRTRTVSHVGIYSGHDQFIHAATGDRTVRISSLSNDYFRTRYKGARRYF